MEAMECSPALLKPLRTESEVRQLGRDDILAKYKALNRELSKWLDHSRDPMSAVWDALAGLHDDASNAIGIVERAIEKDPEELRERAAEERNNRFLASAQATGR